MTTDDEMRAFARQLFGASDDEPAPTPPRLADGNVVPKEGTNSRPPPSADEELRAFTRLLLHDVPAWDHPNL